MLSLDLLTKLALTKADEHSGATEWPGILRNILRGVPFKLKIFPQI